MARGGKRPNAGRKPGSANTKTRDIANKAAEEGITPLEVMLGAMREQWEIGTPEARVAACAIAKDAAPFVHPKLASIDQKHSGSIGSQTKEQRDAAVAAAIRADS